MDTEHRRSDFLSLNQIFKESWFLGLCDRTKRESDETVVWLVVEVL